MEFTLNNKALLTNMDPATRQAVKQYLTMPNPKYAETERMNRSTRDLDRELKFYEDNPAGLLCSRGCAVKLYRLCERMAMVFP